MAPCPSLDSQRGLQPVARAKAAEFGGQGARGGRFMPVPFPAEGVSPPSQNGEGVCREAGQGGSAGGCGTNCAVPGAHRFGPSRGSPHILCSEPQLLTLCRGDGPRGGRETPAVCTQIWGSPRLG